MKKSDDFRELAASLVNDKLLKEYIDSRLLDLQSEFKKEINSLKNDVTASTDMSLEGSLKVDDLLNVFKAAFGSHTSAPQIVTQPQNQPSVSAPIKIERKKEEPKKPKNGMETLEPLRREQWAKAIAEINQRFPLDKFDFRILFFLHECGPQTAHTLRDAGVWRPTDSATWHLEDMEARGLVKPDVAKRWGITKKGVGVLEDALYEDEAEEAPQQTSAFEKIEKGLTEALAVARGEPNHAKFVTPAQPAPESPKPPALSIVPQTPRVLHPVAQTARAPSDLSIQEELLLYLHKNPEKSTKALKAEQLQTGLRGYGAENDIGILTARLAATGLIQSEKRGGAWTLTSLGRNRVLNILKGAA